MRIKASLHYCPDNVQTSVWTSWTQLQSLTDQSCDSRRPPEDTTPECLNLDYRSREGVCEPYHALVCMSDLVKEVFNVRGTEQRFCA